MVALIINTLIQFLIMLFGGSIIAIVLTIIVGEGWVSW